MHQITEHFTLFEARCRCGCGVEHGHIPEITAQAVTLEAFRASLNVDPALKYYLEGSPSGEFRLFAKSWIRCESWNEHEGGADDSHHLPKHCDATDIFSPELDASKLYPLAQDFFKTVIFYRGRGFIHVDRRLWLDSRIHAWVEAPSPTAEPERA